MLSSLLWACAAQGVFQGPGVSPGRLLNKPTNPKGKGLLNVQTAFPPSFLFSFPLSFPFPFPFLLSHFNHFKCVIHGIKQHCAIITVVHFQDQIPPRADGLPLHANAQAPARKPAASPGAGWTRLGLNSGVGHLGLVTAVLLAFLAPREDTWPRSPHPSSWAPGGGLPGALGSRDSRGLQRPGLQGPLSVATEGGAPRGGLGAVSHRGASSSSSEQWEGLLLGEGCRSNVGSGFGDGQRTKLARNGRK